MNNKNEKRGRKLVSLSLAFVNTATVLMTSPLPPSLFTRSAGFTHFLILLLLLLLVPLDNSSQAGDCCVIECEGG